MTFVDRATRCIIGWRVELQRTGTILQEILTHSVQAQRYFSDRFDAYQTLLYWPAVHTAMGDKSQTYSVEGTNAHIRHYLARLARRTRCFSRCVHALRRALHLFIFAYNRRPLYKHRFPAYNPPLIDFIYP